MRGTKKRKVSIVSGKTMSVDEVASVLGYDKEYLRKRCAELGFTRNGVKTALTEEQVSKLKSILIPRTSDMKVRGQNAVTSLERHQTIMLAMKYLQEDYQAMKVRAELAEEENKTLRIELDESKEYMTVKRMELLNPGKHFDWRLLKKESERLGYERKEVFDANYGTVKAYHVNVWESLYFDNINYPAA